MSRFRPGNPSNAGNNAIHHPQRRETFKIDASTAVNSQQQRRIQLQGNSPYTTRIKRYNPARPWARGRPQRGGAAYRTPAPADWQPTPNRCKRPWGIGPGVWNTSERITGESDRRHLSRGPMSAAIEQSWPHTSYPGQPASSISIVHQSKRLHVELPHQGQQAARARGVAGGGVAGGGVAVAWLMITP